jgi:hypothetical protein
VGEGKNERGAGESAKLCTEKLEASPLGATSKHTLIANMYPN